MYVIATPHPPILDLERSLQSSLQRGIRDNVLLIISLGIFLIWWWMMVITTIISRSDQYFVDNLYQIYISFDEPISRVASFFLKTTVEKITSNMGQAPSLLLFHLKQPQWKNSRWDRDNLKFEGYSEFAFTVQYFCNTPNHCDSCWQEGYFTA